MQTGTDTLFLGFIRLSLLFLVSCLVLAWSGFLLGLPLTAWHLPLAALVAVVGGVAQGLAVRLGSVPGGDPGTARRAVLGTALAAVLVAAAVMAAVALARRMPDLSYDGNAYHLVGAIALRDGWNPLRGTGLLAWATQAGLYDPQALQGIANGGLWNDHYPKASWVLGAMVLKWVPDVQATSWLQSFGAVLAFAALRQGLRSLGLGAWATTLLAAAGAGSPIMLAQVWTNYVDGLMGSFLLASAALLWRAHQQPQAHGVPLEALLAALLAANLKFTGLVYGVLLLAVFLLLSRPLRAHLAWLWRGRPVLLAGVLAGAVLVSWNPYGSNLVGHGHPFHPMQQTDVMAGQADADFLVRGRWVKFWGAGTASLMPRAAWSGQAPVWAERPALWRYRDALRSADTRVQGMGPHFVLLLPWCGLVAALALVLARRRHLLAQAGPVLLALGGYGAWVLACMLVNPEFWWARYLPQLWPLPLVLGLVPLLLRQRVLAVLALAPPLLLSAGFALGLLDLLPQRQQQSAELLVRLGGGALRVSDAPSADPFLFTLAAAARERGTQLERVPASQCLPLPGTALPVCR